GPVVILARRLVIRRRHLGNVRPRTDAAINSAYLAVNNQEESKPARADNRVYHYDSQGYRVDQHGNRYDDEEGYWVDERGFRHEYQDPPLD
ncbi:MAG: hypothetical protein ABI831_18505, partial [Betaproteobacteria bacterium]